MSHRLALGAALAALLAASCGPSDPPLSPEAMGGLLQVMNKVSHAPYQVAHLGERKVEFHLDVGSQTHDLYLTERAGSDGQGRYTIETLAVAGDVPADIAAFKVFLSSSSGFYYQYRDFLVRDWALFAFNYQIQAQPTPVSVAGRACIEFRAQRASGNGGSLIADLDVENGLVLAYSEFSANGALLAKMEYQSLDLQPDFTMVALKTLPVHETFALDASASALLGFQPFEPRQLPAGYQLREARKVVDPTGATWACLEYSDGADSLFFLHGGVVPKTGHEFSAQPAQFQTSAAPKMYCWQAGAWVATQGVWQGHAVAAIGKVPQHELLALVESALP